MECKQFCSSLNDGDGASLGEKQHLIVAYGAISFHGTKLKKKRKQMQTTLNAFEEAHRATLK